MHFIGETSSGFSSGLVGFACLQEFFLYPSSFNRWCDLLGYGGEGNVSGRVPEHKQLRPGEEQEIWVGLKLEQMSSGHRRVDSGGRGGFQWKENAGKNVSLLSHNLELYNHCCVCVCVCVCVLGSVFCVLCLFSVSVSVACFIFSGRLVIIVSLGFGIVKPRLGPLLNR